MIIISSGEDGDVKVYIWVRMVKIIGVITFSQVGIPYSVSPTDVKNNKVFGYPEFVGDSLPNCKQ